MAFDRSNLLIADDQFMSVKGYVLKPVPCFMYFFGIPDFAVSFEMAWINYHTQQVEEKC